jgi:DNA-binding NtrC family response regulator
MKDRLHELINSLLRVTFFEEAAGLTLRAMLDVAQKALEESPYAGQGRIIRGLFHLRPLDGYRQLVMLEADQTEISPALSGNQALLPSTTAWRWVREKRCAVSIDVGLAQIRPHLPESETVLEEALLAGTLDSAESRLRFQERHATHVHVVPLHSPGGNIEGMVSIEAECRAAMGREFIWGACSQSLQLLADVAVPYLSVLPMRPASAIPPDEFMPVIGKSMEGLMKILQVFAQQEETILLSGPTGTGKSRLARWCHEHSQRQKGPFESLDLTTVPEELQLAELFGWRKGAFTGAVKDNPGAIARAEGGTLFIDEIDKLSLRAQAGLLLMLDRRSYRVLGEGTGERQANVRFITGTNIDLQAAVRAGKFREDLYYRINVLPVILPALAERTDEIPRWAQYMLQRRHREAFTEGQAHLSPEAAHVLLCYSWPGNLRQLDNIIRRAYTLAIVEHGDAPQRLLVQQQHVERALQYDQGASVKLLPELLLLAAKAFVLEAEHRQQQGRVLPLELCEAFSGIVLGTAAEKLGIEQAFLLFGKENVVKNRNMSKILRREIERADELYRALGHGASSPFRSLLKGEDGEGGVTRSAIRRMPCPAPCPRAGRAGAGRRWRRRRAGWRGRRGRCDRRR